MNTGSDFMPLFGSGLGNLLGKTSSVILKYGSQQFPVGGQVFKCHGKLSPEI
jgi:hypothetical protein